MVMECVRRETKVCYRRDSVSPTTSTRTTEEEENQVDERGEREPTNSRSDTALHTIPWWCSSEGRNELLHSSRAQQQSV